MPPRLFRLSSMVPPKFFLPLAWLLAATMLMQPCVWPFGGLGGVVDLLMAGDEVDLAAGGPTRSLESGLRSARQEKVPFGPDCRQSGILGDPLCDDTGSLGGESSRTAVAGHAPPCGGGDSSVLAVANRPCLASRDRCIQLSRFLL